MPAFGRSVILSCSFELVGGDDERGGFGRPSCGSREEIELMFDTEAGVMAGDEVAAVV